MRFLAKSLAWQSALALNRQETESLLQQSFALLDDPRLAGAPGDAERAFAHYRLGQALYNSQMARAIDNLNQGLGLYQDLGDLWGVGYCLQYLGFTNLFVNLEACRHYLLKAGEVFEQSRDNRGLAQTLDWLIGAAALQGDDQTMAEAVSKFRALVAGMEPQAFFEEMLFVNSLISEAIGQYRDTVTYHEEIASYYEELGRNSLAQLIYLASSYLHAGQFAKGRTLLQQTRESLQETAVEYDHRLAFCFHILASLALAENDFAGAQGYLLEAMPVYKKNNTLPDLAGAQAMLGIALTGQSDRAAARPHLVAALKLALEHWGIIPLGEALLGIALLLAHEGQAHQAREIYELVWRLPRFHRSALYDSIAAKKIRALTAGISPDNLNTIAQQAAESDIWQEAATLLDELLAAGWENPQSPP